MIEDICRKIAEYGEIGIISNSTKGANYVGISVVEYKVITRVYTKKSLKDLEKATKDFKLDLFWYGVGMGILPNMVNDILDNYPYTGKFFTDFMRIKKIFKKNEFKVSDMKSDRWYNLVTVIMEKPKW